MSIIASLVPSLCPPLWSTFFTFLMSSVELKFTEFNLDIYHCVLRNTLLVSFVGGIENLKLFFYLQTFPDYRFEKILIEFERTMSMELGKHMEISFILIIFCVIFI